MNPVVEPDAVDVVSEVMRPIEEAYEVPADRVLGAAQWTWLAVRENAWRFAFLLHRAWEERLYEPAGFRSFSAWAEEVLGKDSAVSSKWRGAAAYVLQLEDEETRHRVMAGTQPASLSEAGIPRLALTDPAEAERLASAGLPSRQLTQAVRARMADTQHYDTAALKTFRVLISETSYARLVGAWNVIRFMCQSPRPTDSELAELLAFELVSGVQIPPEVLERFPLEDIEKGKVRCIECGVTAPQMLEAHHVIPKSHQGHEGPLVWLCQADHQAVTENVTGTWRVRLQQWMQRKDLAWLVEEVNAYLAGRRLEDL